MNLGNKRKIKISNRKKRKMTKDIQECRSIRNLSVKHHLSRMTAYRAVRYSTKNKNGLIPYKSKMKIHVTVKQKKKRLNYALKYQNQNWKNVTFADEKPFYLHKIPNKQNYRSWLKPENKNKIDCFPKFKQDSIIHTFAAINWYGKSKIRFYINNKG